MKRATAHLSTGQSVLVVPDMNLVGAQGADVSGTAKFLVYVSTDSARTAYTMFAYTPAVAPMLAAKSAICSVARSASDNRLLIAYQGIDNSVRLITLAWSGTAYTGGTEQTVIAANAVTNRIRAIDVDDTGPSIISPAVAVYESLASSGQGAYVRAYIRKDDQTTWIKAWEEQIFTSQFINAGSEDICIAWDASNLSANVNRLAIYYTRNHTTGDLGDKVVEISVNVNTATTNSATLTGTWFSNLNQNIAAGTRRGWLFSEASGVWMFATSVGSTSPFFMAARLYHNVFTGIIQNKTVQSPATQAQPTSVFNIVRSIFPQGAVACSFSDGRVMFTYSGLGLLVSYTTRSVVIRFSTTTTVTSALSIDTAPRIFDLGYTLADGVIGVYGGDNKRLSVGDFQFNVMAMYGNKGVSLNAINNDTFDRTVANGLGTSNSGYAWSVIGTASNYAVNGSAATMSMAAVNTAYKAITTAGPSAADSSQYVDITVPVLATGATINVGLVARYLNASNFYELNINFLTTNAIQLTVNKTVAGAVSTVAGPTASGLTHVAGTTYRIKLLVTGNAINAYIWSPGGVEPAPQIATTDASLSSAGQQGFSCSRNTGNTNGVQSITFDNYAYFAALQFISRRARAVTEDVPSAPTVVAPINTVVAKNTLDMRVQSQNINIYSNALGKVEVQLAVDAGFTTSLRTITEADSSYVSLSATTGTTPPIRVTTLTASGVNALFAGTWYLRARMIDDLGGASSYSATVSFIVSHPPTATPTAPAAGSSLIYGTGDVTFSWNFSDSEPTDTQSAYQVIVARLDTGAIVWDSGKVISSAKSAVNNFASGLKDIPMQWTVSLWDSGNSQGPLSAPGMFTVMDPPTVSITAPTGASTVTTALPTITWNFTAGGTRTQRGYRVLIYDRDPVPDVVVADTGWLMGAAVSYTFPTQVLQQSDINAFTEGFEAGVAGWTATNCTIASNAVNFHSGTKSALLTVTGTPTQAYARPGEIPVVGGDWYYASTWVHCVAGYSLVGVAIDWIDATHTYISTTIMPGNGGPLAANTWEQRVIASAQAPANAAYAVVGPTISGNPPTSTAVSFDDVAFDELNYQVYVYVQDTVGLQAVDNELFITDWVPPAQAAATATSLDNFKITVAWTNAAQDANWISWRVYRRYMVTATSDLDLYDTAHVWTLVDEQFASSASMSFQDYLAPLNRQIQYCVVQLADRFGSMIESDIVSMSTITLVGDRYYFVPEVPIGSIASFEAANVTADGFAKEVEQAVIHVKGRGRQVQIGDDLGYIGSLTIKLRNPATARRDREFFEFLSSDDAGNVYIRSPFGDVLYVAFGNIPTTRIAGTGLGDMADITVPYMVVFGTLPVTRNS
jgi:hypothetical protein